MQSGSTRQSSLLDDLSSVLAVLIKQPVREAVQEALVEERARTVAAATPDEPGSADSGQVNDSSPTFGGKLPLLAIVGGLTALAYLLRRRDFGPGTANIGDRLLGEADNDLLVESDTVTDFEPGTVESDAVKHDDVTAEDD
jgi:hypothetical protein